MRLQLPKILKAVSVEYKRLPAEMGSTELSAFCHTARSAKYAATQTARYIGTTTENVCRMWDCAAFLMRRDKVYLEKLNAIRRKLKMAAILTDNRLNTTNNSNTNEA